MSEKLDELNKLFTSKNPEDVMRFYDHFDNAEQLISWMKDRPSAPMRIFEQKGKKDIVVVIPTANHNGKLANNCKKIFKGLQIVFVESNGPFFNYARSCNLGLKYASNYKPKWLVLSNDDIQKTEKISVVRSKILALDPNKVKLAVPVQVVNNSIQRNEVYLVKSNKLSFIYYSLLSLKYLGIMRVFFFCRLSKRLKLNYLVGGKHNSNRFFFKKVFKFILPSYFIIINSDFLKMKNLVFDETFVNGEEDTDLVLRNLSGIYKMDLTVTNVGNGGNSLGVGKIRNLRNISNRTYLNYKIFSKNYFIKV
jgi:hypothetical protein